MNLRLYHGRLDPDVDVEGWGFDGPILEEVVELRWTYTEIFVIFASFEAVRDARKRTGWRLGVHENSLVLRTHNDLVQTHQYTMDGENITTQYYGDWKLLP